MIRSVALLDLCDPLGQGDDSAVWPGQQIRVREDVCCQRPLIVELRKLSAQPAGVGFPATAEWYATRPASRSSPTDRR